MLGATAFQSTRPMRGATFKVIAIVIILSVSIHAPHAGRDTFIFNFPPCFTCFNPRAPCGARPLDLLHCAIWQRFNPRAPCGARHSALVKSVPLQKFQSTRPMRGATRPDVLRFSYIMVSIHAPHAGRDFRAILITCKGIVSIHAPHAGRDVSPVLISITPPSFNPRAPCGARPQ